MSLELDIRHLPGRVEVLVDGRQGVAEYQLEDGVMRATHTLVDPALRGRGIAAALVDALLAHARAQGYKVEPICSFVRGHMERHPETRSLRA